MSIGAVSRPGKLCASCASWDIEAATAAQSKAGQARCSDYGHTADWNDVFCVLYRPATSLNSRRAWVKNYLAAPTVTEGGQA